MLLKFFCIENSIGKKCSVVDIFKNNLVKINKLKNIFNFNCIIMRKIPVRTRFNSN